MTLNGNLVKVSETTNPAEFHQHEPIGYSVSGGVHLITLRPPPAQGIGSAIDLGTFKSDYTAGQICARTFVVGAHADLEKTPVPNLVQYGTLSSVNEISTAELHSVDADSIVQAGPDFQKQKVFGEHGPATPASVA